MSRLALDGFVLVNRLTYSLPVQGYDVVLIFPFRLVLFFCSESALSRCVRSGGFGGEVWKTHHPGTASVCEIVFVCTGAESTVCPVRVQSSESYGAD